MMLNKIKQSVWFKKMDFFNWGIGCLKKNLFSFFAMLEQVSDSWKKKFMN